MQYWYTVLVGINGRSNLQQHFTALSVGTAGGERYLLHSTMKHTHTVQQKKSYLTHYHSYIYHSHDLSIYYYCNVKVVTVVNLYYLSVFIQHAFQDIHRLSRVSPHDISRRIRR
jgi:hypothetical protein